MKNENLKLLKSKIEDLETLTNNNDNQIVKKLQEINKCFLQNYIIQINNLKIYPVETEIYYFNCKKEKDCE